MEAAAIPKNLRVPPSIEVAMSELDDLRSLVLGITAGQSKIMEAVARLEEGARHRTEQIGHDHRALEVMSERISHVERTTSDAKTALMMMKWLFATSIAVGGLAVALLGIYH